MLIKEVITLATYSELAGTAAKNNLDVTVAFLNLGMLELHARFPIKVEEEVVTLSDASVYYDMPSNFMYATHAYGEAPEGSSDKAVPISINNEDDPYSVFFNDWNTLQVPASVTGTFVSIIYVAKPEIITTVHAEDNTIQLDLPDALIDCLLSYVGYKAHLGIKSDSQSENNAHWKRFERNCKRAEDLGVAFPGDTMNMSGRISDRGFV